MAVETRTVLKTYFETADVPTEEQFGKLIDSLQHVNDNTRTLSFSADGTFTVPAGKNLEKIFILSNAAQTLKVGTTGAGSEDLLPERTVANGAELVVSADVWARAAGKVVYVTASDITVWLKEVTVAPLT